jgi:hypothetical protein
MTKDMNAGNDLVRVSKTPLEIEFERLLGFSAITELLGGGVDFQDPSFAAKLGAKVGELDK